MSNDLISRSETEKLLRIYADEVGCHCGKYDRDNIPSAYDMKKNEEPKEEVVKSYKGFHQDMTCTPEEEIEYQYEEGQEYETDRSEVCGFGFHAYEHPLDVFRYYSPNKSVYHEVEQSGIILREDEGSKVVSSKIKIGAAISIAELVKAAIEYTVKRAEKENESTVTWNRGASSSTRNYGASTATGNGGASTVTGASGASAATGYGGASTATGNHGASAVTGVSGASTATGYGGASTATGDYGASTATGSSGASTATGNHGASAATGNYGASTATGDYGASTATGPSGVSTATGDYGVSAATGHRGVSAATGYYGVSAATGYCGAAIADNPTAVAAAWGCKSRARGVKGAHLVFADWEYDETEGWKLKGAKMVQVDGEAIKENVWYVIENGEIKGV